MSEKQQTILLIAAIIGCIVLYIKLSKASSHNSQLDTKNKNLNSENKSLQRLNSKLEADNALLEAEQLKFQLQPHTLNNILANLKSIANKLNKGMGSLSETLHYILYKGQTHLVSIEDELNFIKKYLALNDLFISEIDTIKFDDSHIDSNAKHYTSPCVPHLVTAYFIENAFKHGDVNHPEFLKIEVKLSDTTFEMNVVNRIRKKENETKGGLGLTNMKKRLDLLLSDKYKVITGS